jgi:hypothetical protein
MQCNIVALRSMAAEVYFDLVPNDRLLTKITASGVGSRVVVWIRKFLLGPT